MESGVDREIITFATVTGNTEHAPGRWEERIRRFNNADIGALPLVSHTSESQSRYRKAFVCIRGQMRPE